MNKPTPGPWTIKASWPRSILTLNPASEYPLLVGEFTLEEDALFTIAAHAACRSINPDNPLAVAEALPELVEACRKAHELLSGGNVASYPLSVNHLLQNALNKLEAKP